jgi:hypothetical protein
MERWSFVPRWLGRPFTPVYRGGPGVRILLLRRSSAANLFTASARAGANLVPKKLPGPLPRPTRIRCRFIYASDPGGSPSGKRMLRITTACPSIRPIAIRSSRVSQRMVRGGSISPTQCSASSRAARCVQCSLKLPRTALSQSFAGTIFRKVRSNASGLSYASISRAVRQVQTGVQMTDPEDRPPKRFNRSPHFS